MKKIITIAFLVLSVSLYAQVYNGLGGALPDVSTSVFTINVSGLSPSTLSAAHGLVRVCIDITHTYDGDLNISLASPAGNMIVLVANVGGGGQNFTSTCLDDHATNNIALSSAPFTGVFSPSENLGNMNDGGNGNGLWTLSIRDDGAADTGILNSWSIAFDTGATAPFVLSSSNLPIVIINTLGQAIVDEPKINCTMKIINNAVGLRNNVADLPQYDAEVGIEIRGNYSSILPQKPYAFATQDILHADSNTVIVGMPSEHDWILQSTYNDKTFMRNQMIFDLARKMGDYAPRTVSCEVIINNQYKGIYFLCEKIKRDANRVDIARLDLDDNAGDSLTGGYIFKHDYDDIGWDSYWTDTACPTRPFHYNYYYPKSGVITVPQQDYIKNYVDSFEVALFGTSFQDTVWGYQRFIDQNTFVDYLILNELAANGDGYKKSMFFNKNKSGKIKAGPIWDFDWALKFSPGFDSALGGWLYQTPTCAGDVLFTPWFKRLMEDTVFSNAVYCRWTALRASLLIDTSTLYHTIDSFALHLDEAQVRHFDKWRILGLDSGSPEIYPIPTTYQEELNRYKYFYSNRIKWIDEHIEGHCYIAPIDTTHHIDTLGVAQISTDLSNAISVYPNPSSHFVQIACSNLISMQEITLSNTIGSILERKVLNRNTRFVELNLADYAAGNYLIRITDAQGNTYMKKLVKE